MRAEGLGGGVRLVTHRRQRFHWDCGVACVLMCLPGTRQVSEDEWRRQEFGRSTWTIDLAYLVRRFGLEATFCTTTIGVTPSFETQPFYSKAISQDEERVLRLFEGAAEAGVRVEQRHLELEEVMGHVEAVGAALALTDGGRLRCVHCSVNRLRRLLPWTPSFSGHYVLIVGCHPQNRLIYYRNPAFADRVCAMSFEDFDEARLAFGTDEDLLLVHTPHLQFKTGANPFH